MKNLSKLSIKDTLSMDKNVLMRALTRACTDFGLDCWLVVPERYNGKTKIPCLVSHIDTAHDLYYTRSKEIYCDSSKSVLWSPDGLGADDRAGVYACIQIYTKLPANKRPMVLFTDKEETFGVGANEACYTLYDMLKHVSFFIGLDRRGKDDAVFYNNESDEFKKFILRAGFKEAIGTFSDILILGRFFGVNGANLSIGYYNEHSLAEYLKVDEMNATIDKVVKLLSGDVPAHFKPPHISPQKPPYISLTMGGAR